MSRPTSEISTRQRNSRIAFYRPCLNRNCAMIPIPSKRVCEETRETMTCCPWTLHIDHPWSSCVVAPTRANANPAYETRLNRAQLTMSRTLAWQTSTKLHAIAGADSNTQNITIMHYKILMKSEWTKPFVRKTRRTKQDSQALLDRFLSATRGCRKRTILKQKKHASTSVVNAALFVLDNSHNICRP
jgi:hypothetical protein